MEKDSDLLSQLRLDKEARLGDSGDLSSTRRLAVLVGMVIISLAVVATTAWVWFVNKRIPEVRTTAVTPSPADSGRSGSVSVLDGSGYVVARRMATVSAKVTGRVSEVLIEEGQHVAAGQIMATLDSVDAEAQMDLAKAQLITARSEVESIRAQVAEAEANVSRLLSLMPQQLIAKSRYDEAVAQRDSLRAQLTAAEGGVQVATERQRIASIGVDNTIVRAPFSGVITAKAAQPGEIVSPLSAGGGFTRTGIGTIVDMDSLEVEVDVSEAFIGRVEPKMPVEVTLNAYPDWKIQAEVVAVVPTADRGKATVKVRIGFETHDARIVPDMGVRVRFLEAVSSGERDQRIARRGGVRIPQAAVLRRESDDVSFVVVEDRVELRTLNLGKTFGEQIQILDGISVGEVVVLDPPAALTDGAQVRVAHLAK